MCNNKPNSNHNPKSLIEQNQLLKTKIENIIQFISHGYLLGEIQPIEKGKADAIILNLNKQLADMLNHNQEYLIGRKISACIPEILIHNLISEIKSKKTFYAEKPLTEFNKYIRISAFSVSKDKFIAFFEDKTANIKNHLEIIKSHVEKAKYKDELFDQYKSLDQLNIQLKEKVVELNAKNKEIEAANKKLAESELKMRMAIKAANLGIWDYDISNQSLTYDDTATRLLKLPQKMQNGVPFKSLEQLIHPEDLKKTKKNAQEFITGNKKEFRSEFRIKSFRENNPTWYIFQLHGKIIQHKRNIPTRMIGTYLDMTAQKKAETEIIETRKFLELILENTPSGIFTVNTKKIITNWNKRAEEIFEYSAEEVVGKKCSLFSSKDCEETCNLLELPQKKPIINKECIIKTKSGKTKYIKKNINEITNSEGKIIGGVESFEDITEMKNMEKRILHAIIETEEKERQHISKELHDGLGSMISSIKLHMNMIQSAKINEHKKNEIIKKTNLIINETSQSIRDIANHLRPSLLSDFGLLEATCSFCQKINDTNVLQVEFKHHNIDQVKLNQSFETNIYRIAQELLNNTLKHANAKIATLELMNKDNLITLSYKDDGIGFNLDKTLKPAPAGHGIKNIISRSISIGADYVIGNNSEKGMFALITYNLNEHERN